MGKIFQKSISGRGAFIKHQGVFDEEFITFHPNPESIIRFRQSSISKDLPEPNEHSKIDLVTEI